MMGLPLEEDMLSDMRAVIDNALADKDLAAGRDQVRNEVWQHRGEAAVRTVDHLVAARDEVLRDNIPSDEPDATSNATGKKARLS